jgi:hypothetical protein
VYIFLPFFVLAKSTESLRALKLINDVYKK